MKKNTIFKMFIIGMLIGSTTAKANSLDLKTDTVHSIVAETTVDGKNLDLDEYTARYNNLKSIWNSMGYNIEHENMVRVKSVVSSYIMTDMINDTKIQKAADELQLTASKSEISENSVFYKQTSDKTMKPYIEKKYKIYALDNKIRIHLYSEFDYSRKDAKKYFEEHKKEFAENPTVWARHILVDSKEEAQEIYDLLVSGVSFVELAKKHSIDTESGQYGGDIGRFQRGVMGLSNFDEYTFELNEGEFSVPFETEMGWHIVKVDEYDLGEVISFDEHEDAIIEYIKGNEFAKVLEDFYNSLKIKVVIPNK